jgi:hypothetical protein
VITMPRKRTGRLQRAILDHLRARGQWQWLLDLAWDLYPSVVGEGKLTLAFYNSTSRAANTLARRGEIRVGYANSGLAADTRLRTACWLPGHATPELIAPLAGTDIERVILDTLNDPNIDRYYLLNEEGLRWVDHGFVSDRILNKWNVRMNDDPRYRVAISRCLRRLEARGIVERRREWRGNRLITTYVRLVNVEV